MFRLLELLVLLFCLMLVFVGWLFVARLTSTKR